MTKAIRKMLIGNVLTAMTSLICHLRFYDVITDNFHFQFVLAEIGIVGHFEVLSWFLHKKHEYVS